MSQPELLLWLRLRTPGEGCPRFRRQHPVGPHVLDFFCPTAKLAVEIDGASHDMGDRSERDERRDRWLTDRGFVVRRVSARDVLAGPGEAARAIVDEAAALAGPPPSRRWSAAPPPRCAGEEDGLMPALASPGDAA
jgi:very-short-patch-repair endonuclease